MRSTLVGAVEPRLVHRDDPASLKLGPGLSVAGGVAILLLFVVPFVTRQQTASG